ncbi:MAG: hypothetical protein JO197_16290 [Acidobacteria bacterium]|nr:hypothetical protein [Acidobacteriota bacterium]MBV9475362.1 hypothetical protein [Acidobacteriota bacterium]
MSNACLHVTSVAVARFDSADTNDELGFGFAVLLIEQLRGVASLRVVPGRQSLAPCDDTPEEVGRRSGVDAVLTGTLHVEGDALTVVALLVDPLTERELWTDRYAVHCHDILHVARGIAERVCDAIVRGGSIGRRLAPASAHAWDAFCAYAAARSLDWFGADDALPRAARLYERAAVLAPMLVSAAAARAFALALLIADGRRDARELASVTEAATAALRRDRMLADAWAALGLVALLESDSRKSESCLRRALQLDPLCTRARLALADALDSLQKPEEAARERAVCADAAREPFACSLPALYTTPEIPSHRDS